MESSQKKVGIGATLAILTIAFAGMCSFIVNPALSSIAANYPDIPFSTITYVSTTISLVAIPFSLIAGAIAGTKVKFKTLAIIACALIAFGGTAGYFATSFPILLFTRALVGAGIGLSTPLGAALIMQLFDKERASVMNGWFQSVQNVMAIAYQILAGSLAGIDARLCFVLHLFLLVPLVLVIAFLKEPRGQNATTSVPQDTPKPAEKTRIPTEVWVYCALNTLMFMCFYPLLLNVSSVFTGEGLGDPALVGILSAMFSVGGTVVGLFFGSIFKILGRKWTIPLSLALSAACMFIAFSTSSVPLWFAAFFVAGMGINATYPGSIMEFGYVCSPDRMTFASGLFFAALNLGGFLSSSFVAFAVAITGTSDPRMTILVGAIGLTIVTVVWSAYVIFKKTTDYTPTETA